MKKTRGPGEILARLIKGEISVSKRTQADLSEALNVSRQTLSKWTSNPLGAKMEDILRLCSELGISIEDVRDCINYEVRQ